MRRRIIAVLATAFLLAPAAGATGWHVQANPAHGLHFKTTTTPANNDFRVNTVTNCQPGYVTLDNGNSVYVGFDYIYNMPYIVFGTFRRCTVANAATASVVQYYYSHGGHMANYFSMNKFPDRGFRITAHRYGFSEEDVILHRYNWEILVGWSLS